MKKHLNIAIRGKVQGVWYRGSARQQAQGLSLSGYVENRPDGSVYAEVEGEEENLNAFLAWCRRGPELARVDSLDIAEGPCQGFTCFEIRR